MFFVLSVKLVTTFVKNLDSEVIGEQGGIFWFESGASGSARGLVGATGVAGPGVLGLPPGVSGFVNGVIGAFCGGWAP